MTSNDRRKNIYSSSVYRIFEFCSGMDLVWTDKVEAQPPVEGASVWLWYHLPWFYYIHARRMPQCFHKATPGKFRILTDETRRDDFLDSENRFIGFFREMQSPLLASSLSDNIIIECPVVFSISNVVCSLVYASGFSIVFHESSWTPFSSMKISAYLDCRTGTT